MTWKHTGSQYRLFYILFKSLYILCTIKIFAVKKENFAVNLLYITSFLLVFGNKHVYTFLSFYQIIVYILSVF